MASWKMTVTVLLDLAIVVIAKMAGDLDNQTDLGGQDRRNSIGNSSAQSIDIGISGPPPELRDRLLAKVFPGGVPTEISGLLAQGTPESLKQAWLLIRQARGTQAGEAPPQAFLTRALNRAFPEGVPVEVSKLLAEGTPEALRKVRAKIRQAMEQGTPGAVPSWRAGGEGQGAGQERLLARVFPEGVPRSVRELLEQGTPASRRQAWSLVRQALLERFPNGFLGRVVSGFRRFSTV